VPLEEMREEAFGHGETQEKAVGGQLLAVSRIRTTRFFVIRRTQN
jgi:hypothetical protein